MADDIATQVAQAPKGEEYGEAEAQLQRQQIQPVAGAATPTPSHSPGPSQPMMTGMGPGEIPSLQDPSAFPEEPLTTGLVSGPGAGPEALRSASFGPQELSVLRAIFLKHPNDDLRRMIEWTESNLA